jgi:ParB/RepB/Spo0J family partition protein
MDEITNIKWKQGAFIDLVRIDKIKINPNRVRTEFDQEKIEELKKSISSTFLQNPITCRNVDGVLELVSGERRLRAVKALDKEYDFAGVKVQPGYIPVISLDDLLPDAALEAEIEENIRRVDISWQDRVAALDRLNSLRRRQASERGEEWKVRDLAEEIGRADPSVAQTSIRDQLVLAKHLSDPNIVKAKTTKDAIKLVRQKLESQLREMVASKVEEELDAEAESSYIFWNEDYTTVLNNPIEKFDLIIADPPYGIGADKFHRVHNYSDSPAEYHNIISALGKVGFSVCAENAHMYVFLSPRTLSITADALSDAGWDVWPWPLIWNKQGHTTSPAITMAPARQYEMILFCRKGSLPMARHCTDVLSFSEDKHKIHPAQKPISLIQELIERSVSPGSRILIPFAGSGNDILAGLSLKQTVVAYERDPAIYAQAQSHLLLNLKSTKPKGANHERIDTATAVGP